MDFWSDIIYFFSFEDTNINNVLFGTIILGFTCGIVGVLVVLSKKALIVDAISHAVLPGICIGFMFTGVKNPVYLTLGGMLAGAVAVYLVDWISRVSRIKKDASIAISLSVLFSVGVILLNIIQHSGNSNQSGLTDFLFGKAATIVQSDVYVFGVIFGVVVITLIIFYQHFKISLFDISFAKSIGLSQKFTQGLISGLIIISTAVGIQTVGIVLMSALLITPASSALFWTNSFKKAILLSGGFATFSSILGVFISFLSSDMPTGPWIIVVLSFFALLSAFLSKKGLIVKKIRAYKNKKKILSDNLLQVLYKFSKSKDQTKKELSLKEINELYPILPSDLSTAIKSLKKNKYIENSDYFFYLTKKGIHHAEKIIKVNTLREIYMEKFINIDSKHLNSSIEPFNDILIPEIEAELSKKIASKMKNL